MSVSPSETPALRPNSASAPPAEDHQPSPLPSAAASAAPPGARLIPLRGARSARTAESPYAKVPNSTVTTQSPSATRFVPLRLRLGKLQHQQQRREMEGATDIANQGGPILAYPKVYLIYYGTWPEGAGQDAIENFINSLGGDAGNQGDPTGESSVRRWWDISTNYYQNNDDGSQTFVSPEIVFGDTVTDEGSNGWESIDLGTTPQPKSITYQPYSTSPNPSSVTPNGMPGIDGMISTIAHEITEAATNPDVSSGWMASDGEENADMCAWQYGDVSQDTDGDGNTYDYNMVGNDGMRFMVEGNWDLITNSCQIQAQDDGYSPEALAASAALLEQNPDVYAAQTGVLPLPSLLPYHFPSVTRPKHLPPALLFWSRILTCTYSPEALAASAALLEQNPDVYVTWNYRKKASFPLLLPFHLTFSYSPEALAASAALLEQNPDVYVTWNYRKRAFVHRCGALEAGADGSREGKAVQRGAEVKEGEKEAQGKEAQGEGVSEKGKVGTDGAMGEVESAGGRDGNGEESEVGGENDGKQGEEQERVEREREERVRREEERREEERREEERREEERKIEEAKGKLADEELKLIEAALRTNPKCYGAWHHRRWLFALSSTEPLPSLGASLGPSLQQVRINLRSEARIAREQKLLGMMLSADDRNFHAWDYWRFISHVAHISPSTDLAFTMGRINSNFSNYSAWHSRSKLLPKLHSCQASLEVKAGRATPSASETRGLPQEALEEECELVRQAFFTEPDDQSGWMYQHWLLQQILPPLPPHLLASWPSPGSTVCFSLPENSPEKSPGGDSAAVEGVSDASAGAAGQVRMSAVLVFSEPVVGVTRESVSLTGAGLEVGEWRAVGGEEAWLSGRLAGCGRETGGNMGHSHATVPPMSLPTHDWSNFLWPSSPSPSPPASAPAAADGAADGDAASAGGVTRGREQWRVDVVQREIDMCRELIDLEPDSNSVIPHGPFPAFVPHLSPKRPPSLQQVGPPFAVLPPIHSLSHKSASSSPSPHHPCSSPPCSKWALLSLARLLSTRRQLHHLLPILPVQARQDAEAREEVRSLLRRLVGIDPYRKEYYRDLLEALEGEEVRRVCVRSVC
ncbi:unnamed protein product [Closterium sp. Naga37s-1]|nr:unnamed protein product [Closterium sp. Naga37s-1]